MPPCVGSVPPGALPGFPAPLMRSPTMLGSLIRSLSRNAAQGTTRREQLEDGGSRRGGVARVHLEVVAVDAVERPGVEGDDLLSRLLRDGSDVGVRGPHHEPQRVAANVVAGLADLLLDNRDQLFFQPRTLAIGRGRLVS